MSRQQGQGEIIQVLWDSTSPSEQNDYKTRPHCKQKVPENESCAGPKGKSVPGQDGKELFYRLGDHLTLQRRAWMGS